MQSYTLSDPLVKILWLGVFSVCWTHSRKQTRLATRCLVDELGAEESPSFREALDLLELPLIPLFFLHCQESFFFFFPSLKCENSSGQAEVCDLCMTTLDRASDVTLFDASCRDAHCLQMP